MFRKGIQLNISSTVAALQPHSRRRSGQVSLAVHALTTSAGVGGEVLGAAAGDPLEALSAEQRRQVDAFVDFLLQENEKMNLTGEAAQASGSKPSGSHCNISVANIWP